MKGFLGIAPEVGGVNITSTGFDFTSNNNIVRDIPEPSVSVLVLILVLLMTTFIRPR